jgi:hydrogenase maturation protein HypF
MVATLEEAKRYCQISAEEARLLSSPQSPIALLKGREDSSLSLLVAPGLKYQGIMLPYTPLHHVLLRKTGLPLVMTSGNLSEEPIAKDNNEALGRLGAIADYFLWHNRDIYARYDDSVAMVVADKSLLVRRARGYAPYPIHLPYKSKQILACGAELKNTFCLTRNEHAFLSQHIADLENLESLEHFRGTVGLYKRLFRIEPEIIACDLHPDYLSTRHATELTVANPELKLVSVQHHYAHIVSCLVENGLPGPAIGVAFDGTGYGSDGNIWGGEFLLSDYRGFERLGHLGYVPLPALVRNLPFLKEVDMLELEIIKQQIDRSINSPLTSSCGRLFDAVSALIGIRRSIDYEAQAAIELEMAATGVNTPGSSCYPFAVTRQKGVSVVKLEDTFSAIITDIEHGIARAEIAYKFHLMVARMIADVSCRLAEETGVSLVALSGGVFQNRLLLKLTLAALNRAGLKSVIHHWVPTNDGGISLGQAVVANYTQG